jgi:hypothetical protein
VPEQQQARIHSHKDDRHESSGIARRRLGGCCKYQDQDNPRRLLKPHHRTEVTSERERHGQEHRVTRIAPTRHRRPSGLERKKRRFHEGRRVAPDNRDCRPERNDDRHQQHGPRQYGPWPRRADAAQRGGSARCTRWSIAVGRAPSIREFECCPSFMLDQNALQYHRRACSRQRTWRIKLEKSCGKIDCPSEGEGIARHGSGSRLCSLA